MEKRKHFWVDDSPVYLLYLLAFLLQTFSTSPPARLWSRWLSPASLSANVHAMPTPRCHRVKKRHCPSPEMRGDKNLENLTAELASFILCLKRHYYGTFDTSTLSPGKLTQNRNSSHHCTCTTPIKGKTWMKLNVVSASWLQLQPSSLITTPQPPPPPPPPTTSIPHIEVGFKWMWTLLVTPNKMAPVVVDLCAGLVVLLPCQIRRFRCEFFSSAVLQLKLEELSSRRHLRRQQLADNRRYLHRYFVPWTSSLRSQISPSKCW